MLTRSQLHILHARNQYETLYNECLQNGVVAYDKERIINGVKYAFIGIVHLGDNWLFEFANDALVRVVLTENQP